MEIRDEDRLLFMKYALPCAGTLVKRGSTSQDTVDSLIDIVKKGGRIPKDSEKMFKVAFSACSLIALDKNKKQIDSEVIRDYYLFGHDVMIDKRYEEMGDFDPNACRIRPGVVREAGRVFAIVENSSGIRNYRTDYCAAKKGDLVVTHWNFVVEKITQEISSKMKEQKIALKVK